MLENLRANILNEKLHAFPFAFKETGSTPYQRMRNLHHQRTSVSQTQPHRVSFSPSFTLVFLLLCLCFYFCYFASCKAQRKNI